MGDYSEGQPMDAPTGTTNSTKDGSVVRKCRVADKTGSIFFSLWNTSRSDREWRHLETDQRVLGRRVDEDSLVPRPTMT